MTLRTFVFAAFASLVLAACGTNGHNHDGDDTDEVHTGETDTTVPNDPFSGDNAVEITFNPLFGDTHEPCMISLECTSTGSTKESVTETVTHLSTSPFTVDADANCVETLGDVAQCHTEDGRPCHTSASGLKWTNVTDLGTDFVDGNVYETVGNWYFHAATLDCFANGVEYVSSNIFVDESNQFRIDGIAGDNNSWFQVIGDWFDVGGTVADLGYSVENVDLTSTSTTFDLTGPAPTHVECTW